MEKVYYYKRDNGVAVFDDGTVMDTLGGGRAFMERLIGIRRGGALAWRLYLDLPDDYEEIKKRFFTPSYWENTTWEKEAHKDA